MKSKSEKSGEGRTRSEIKWGISQEFDYGECLIP